MTKIEAMKIRRMMRRHQLREMVPMADSTIYEMEQRGAAALQYRLDASSGI
ncbi:hypothetical protein [Chelatococcus reniformis]|uniref:hypothetical protein n=1 Tax=Chelatococcus reniformis TaxID=1494448 RepID=UPI00402BA299